jgi:hypothetical protein
MIRPRIALLAATLAFPVAAFAQTAAPPAPPPAEAPSAVAPSPGGPEMPSPGEAGRGGFHGEHHNPAQRLQRIHDRLGITPEQEPLWNNFAGVMRENGARMRADFQSLRANAATLTAQDGLHRVAKMAADRASNMQRMADAFDPLYASFSPTQKQTADKIFHEMAMHRGHHHEPHREGTQPG